MLIKNGTVLTDAWNFADRDIRTSAGIIEDITDAGKPDDDKGLAPKDRISGQQKKARPAPEDEYDAQGLFVLPGLVDIISTPAQGMISAMQARHQ